MEARTKLQQARLALEVTRESEAIWLRLAVSVRSGESAGAYADLRLEGFFRTMRRNLLATIIYQCLKMVSATLSKAIVKCIRALWLKVTKFVKAEA